MQRRRFVTVCAGVLAVSACASKNLPVPVLGSVEELAAVCGVWVGEYRDASSTRAGSIRFSLEAGSDTAFGDVVMIASGRDRSFTPQADRYREEQRRESPRRLMISFVRIAQSRIQGRLEPYVDPECDCTVETVFVGKLSDDMLEGTYESYLGGRNTPRTGQWRAVRTCGPAEASD
ncbi:MAG: hypothetical protein HKM89_08560 [Gemmatimonadales bacterium]|nr:hypothetical protein [Gemmatimonadales bacterium]